MKKSGWSNKTKALRKVGTVMHEFKEGTLHSGKSDKVVKNPKQAIAIALSEAGLSKKETGGGVDGYVDSVAFDKLKKGDKIKITYGSAIQRGNEKQLLVKSKTVVGKGKSWESEKITFTNIDNPTGVNYFAYKRKDGDVGFAIGDMAIWGVKIIEKFAEGGGVDEQGIDLFEDYENIPENVQNILDKYEDDFVDGNYSGLEKASNELEKIGYTFEYYLDGQAYDLRPIGTKGKSEVEEYATGGGITDIHSKVLDYLAKHKFSISTFGRYNNNNIKVEDRNFGIEDQIAIEKIHPKIIVSGSSNSNTWYIFMPNELAHGGGVNINDLDMPVIRTQFEDEEYEYAKGGSVGDSGMITDKNSMFVGKMGTITGDLGNMYEVMVLNNGNKRTVLVKKNGISIVSDEYAKGGGIWEIKDESSYKVLSTHKTKKEAKLALDKIFEENKGIEWLSISKKGFDDSHEFANGGNTGEPHRAEMSGMMARGGAASNFKYEIYAENTNTSEKSIVALVKAYGDIPLMITGLKMGVTTSPIKYGFKQIK